MLFRKNDFSRNVLTLLTGTTIAQAIPIAISPILTRIYTPEDFGSLAIFLSITAIFGAIANSRYELAIMLPKKDEDAINIAALALLINFFITIILLLIVTLFNNEIGDLLKNNDASHWLYFVPLSVFLVGLFNILNYFNNRMGNYKDLAYSNIYRSLALSFSQVCLGLYQTGVLGLIVGSFLSQLVVNIRLLKNILKKFDYRAIISIGKLKKLAIRYIDFPKYSLPAVLSNSLSLNLTNVLIPIFYSTSTLGFYALVQRLLEVPSTLIGSSIGQVFYKSAVTERKLHGTAITCFNSSLKSLLIIGIPFFSILFIVIEDAFALIFGENWRIAGEYGKILIPLFLIRFVAASLSNLTSAFEKQKVILIWQIMLLAISVFTLLISSYLNFEFDDYLMLLTLLLSVHYLILLYVLYLISRARL